MQCIYTFRVAVISWQINLFNIMECYSNSYILKSYYILLLNLEAPYITLDASSLSEICIANVVFWHMACLFIFLIVF